MSVQKKTATSEPEEKRTMRDVGLAEPGWSEFESYYRRNGASEATLREYAKNVGMARTLAGKPLLKLNRREVVALDEKLLSRAQLTRTVVKMFYKAHRKYDLLEEFPRQRRARRNIGLNDVLMPEDIEKLLAACTNLRDRAFIATLTATGARINELLSIRLGDIRQVKGDGYQLWFGKTKVKSQERFSPRIEGELKAHLDRWLKAIPDRGPEAWLFPSTTGEGPVADATMRQLLVSLAKKAGISKRVNPHAFRHARVTWGVMNGEDSLKLSVSIWGKPVTPMMNRYSHFNGIDSKPDEWKAVDFDDVPVMPTPPVLATQKRVQELEVKLANAEAEITKRIADTLAAQLQDALKARGLDVKDRPLTDDEMKDADKKYASVHVHKA